MRGLELHRSAYWINDIEFQFKFNITKQEKGPQVDSETNTTKSTDVNS